MDLQIIIVLSSYTIIAFGSYIIVALREGLVASIKPIKQETIQRMRWFFLILTILWLVAAMVLPGITFILTQNPLSFIFLDAVAPPTSMLMHIAGGWNKKTLKPTFFSPYSAGFLGISLRKLVYIVKMVITSTLQSLLGRPSRSKTQNVDFSVSLDQKTP